MDGAATSGPATPLSPTAVPPSVAPAAAAPAAAGSAAKVAGWGAAAKGVAALCLVGGAAVFSALPRSSAPPTPRAATEHRAEIAPSAPSAAAVEVDAQPGAPEGDALAQEVVLLERATSALKAGRAREALAELDAHAQRFPRGALSEERHAARAQALCTLGRTAEARSALARLPADSPAAAMAKQLCASRSGRGRAK